MEIIQRNFFRLLRSGPFADDELLEPMSAFKWRRLYQMVEVQGVADVFLRGVQKHSGEQGLNMPEEILLRAGQDAQKQQSLAELVSRKVGMSMGMLNKRYVKLLDGERHSIDTSVETMDLLRLLVVNEQDFLNHGINMRGIIFLAATFGRRATGSISSNSTTGCYAFICSAWPSCRVVSSSRSSTSNLTNCRLCTARSLQPSS